MRIIGLNSGYDASMNGIYSGGCALIEDGKIVIALAEDRISRNKNEGGFSNALNHIYKEYGLSHSQIDYFYISFYANPIIPNEDTIRFHLNLLNITDQPEKLVVMPSHHFSHSCLAYYLSPFTDALIMVADNEGCLLSPKDAAKKGIFFNNCERNSYFWAHNNCITLIGRDFQNAGQVSFGKAYNKFNEFIGFGSYLNAGKTMGLSSYGYVPDEWKNLELWHMDLNGNLHSNIIETHDSFDDLTYYFKRNNLDLCRNLSYESQEYKNLATFVQHQLDKWSARKFNHLFEKYGRMNVCVSGGVGLNSIMNANLENELQTELFVPPYCSDPGQALGNAIYGYVSQMGCDNNPLLPKVAFNDYIYLGTEYTNDRIMKELLKEYSDDSRIQIETLDDPLLACAKLLAKNKIVGFFQNRSEYGARALGNRSILALPNSIVLRDRINTLKGRELFRPLAPAVISEYRGKYFEGKPSLLDRMMLRIVKVREEQRINICGVTHIDGTARLQEVMKDVNPRFYELICKLNTLTGIPLIINTSFNRAGEPIVESPHDAVESFLAMGLDALLCGDCLVMRRI
jgi:carbamoyltransferase